MQDFIAEFEDDWTKDFGHFLDGTPLMELIRDPFFYPDQLFNAIEMQVDRLIVLGILMCQGTPN